MRSSSICAAMLIAVLHLSARLAGATTCTCAGTVFNCYLTTESCDPGGLEAQYGTGAPKCDWKCNSTGQCPNLLDSVGGCASDPLAYCDRNGDGKCVVCGTDGAQTIWGTSGNDIICAKGGNDVVLTGDGDDKVDAGSANDTIDCSATNGNKSIWGGSGNDFIAGSSNLYNDSLHGDSGDDCVFGGGGHDFIDGGPNNDMLVTGPFDTNLATTSYGFVTSTRICGGKGDDLIYSSSDGGHCLDAGSDQNGTTSQTFSCSTTPSSFTEDCQFARAPVDPYDVATVAHCASVKNTVGVPLYGQANCGCVE